MMALLVYYCNNPVVCISLFFIGNNNFSNKSTYLPNFQARGEGSNTYIKIARTDRTSKEKLADL